MKKAFSLIIGLFLSFSGFSQSCLPEGIIFSTQAQIDSFQVNYPGCTEIEGNVTIDDNGDIINNLNGLSVLTSIGGDLSILGYHNSLTSLAGLNNVTSIGGNLGIIANYSLTSLTGLDNVTSIGIGLFIDNNNALASLTGLENVTSIGGDIFIDNNNALASLTGWENMSYIGGDLNIQNNNALTSLTGLENVTSMGGALYIGYNNSLTSLTGLDNLTSIGEGFLKIDNNITLTSLTGLEGLTYIGGSLWIGGNASLTSLTGLDNVTYIVGDLKIGYYFGANPSLTDLTGLDNIEAGSITDLSVAYNNSLSACDIQSVCDYLAASNGTIEIHDNATGCNSPEEVEAACEVGLEEPAAGSQQSAVIISPNPASNHITIELPSTMPVGNTNLSIYDINARLVISQSIPESETVVDISGLPCGVYFVRISGEKVVMTGKFIKH